MHVLARLLPVVALLGAFCAGCGSSSPETVKFGSAAPDRQAEFIKAVELALAGFDDIKENPRVSVGIIDDGGRDTVAVRCDGANRRGVESAVSVVVTNIAIKYPGIRFMVIDDGSWKVCIPDETEIPKTGEFGLNIQ